MDASLTVSECIQFTYHHALRNHLLLMYQHDILIIDLNISMTVGVISIDKSFSPFCQVTPSYKLLNHIIIKFIQIIDVFLSTT